MWDKKNYTSFLHLLFSTFQMQAQIGFFVEWPNEHKRMKNWERGCRIYFKELYSDTALLFWPILNYIKLYFGLWALDSGCWSLDAEPWMLDPGCWTVDSWYWILDSGRWTLDAGILRLDATLWTLAYRHWTLSLTVSKQNQNPISDFSWLHYWKFFGCASLRTSCKFWRGYF